MMRRHEEHRYLDVHELAARTGLSPHTMYWWVQQRYIPHLKVGRAIRFDWDVIQAWLASKQRRVVRERG